MCVYKESSNRCVLTDKAKREHRNKKFRAAVPPVTHESPAQPAHDPLASVDKPVYTMREEMSGNSIQTREKIKAEKVYDDITYGPVLSRMADMPLDWDITYANGQSVYRLLKGTLLYHASKVSIDSFDRMAFFTLHPNIALLILAMRGRLLTDNGSAVSDRPLYLYTLEVKKDIYILRNPNMGVPVAGGYREFSPFSTEATPENLESYCRRNKCQGFWSWRDSAPLPRVYDKYGLTSWQTSTPSFLNLLKVNQVHRNEPIYTLEFVLCDPSIHLEQTGKFLVKNKVLVSNIQKSLASSVHNLRQRGLLGNRKEVFEAKAQVVLTAPFYYKALGPNLLAGKDAPFKPPRIQGYTPPKSPVPPPASGEPLSGTGTYGSRVATTAPRSHRSSRILKSRKVSRGGSRSTSRTTSRQARVRKSKVIRAKKSKVTRSKKSKVIRDKKSKVIRTKKSKVIRAKKSKVIRAKKSKVIRAKKSKVTRSKKFKVIRAKKSKVTRSKKSKVTSSKKSRKKRQAKSRSVSKKKVVDPAHKDLPPVPKAGVCHGKVRPTDSGLKPTKGSPKDVRPLTSEAFGKLMAEKAHGGGNLQVSSWRKPSGKLMAETFR